MPTVTVSYHAATDALTVLPPTVSIHADKDTITWKPPPGTTSFKMHRISIEGTPPAGEFGPPTLRLGQIDVAVVNSTPPGEERTYKYTVSIMVGTGPGARMVALDPEIRNVGPPPIGPGHPHGGHAESASA
ncbi:MAG: hypothetical protein ACJ8J0_23345 [Longimicrobiaceae bacterium]